MVCPTRPSGPVATMANPAVGLRETSLDNRAAVEMEKLLNEAVTVSPKATTPSRLLNFTSGTVSPAKRKNSILDTVSVPSGPDRRKGPPTRAKAI